MIQQTTRKTNKELEENIITMLGEQSESFLNRMFSGLKLTDYRYLLEEIHKILEKKEKDNDKA